MTTALATAHQEATELTTAALRLLRRATELALESEELSEWEWLSLRTARQAANNSLAVLLASVN